MVNGRPSRRNLAIRRRWQGRNAQDRMNLSYLNKVCRFFLSAAIMLPAGEIQRVMRTISYIVFIKILSIDEWNNLPADRIEETDVTIDNCSEAQYSSARDSISVQNLQHFVRQNLTWWTTQKSPDKVQIVLSNAMLTSSYCTMNPNLLSNSLNSQPWNFMNFNRRRAKSVLRSDLSSRWYTLTEPDE